MCIRDRLKASKIRLNGTKTVDWDKLAGFTHTMLGVGDFSSTNRGTHDVPLVEISQLEAADSGAAINGARPSTVLETEAGYVVAFPPGGLQRHLTSLVSLADCNCELIGDDSVEILLISLK